MFDFLSQKFSGILSWLKDKGRLEAADIDKALAQVREALIGADVPYELIEDFLANIKNKIVGEELKTKLSPGHVVIKIVHDELLEFLGGKTEFQISFQIPSVVMVLGLQGSGKTTSIAKLAKWVSKEAAKKGKNRRILLASVDFYRPAAVDQLEILSKQVNVDFYRAQSTDPIKAALEIYNYFKSKGYEYLFFDTAGRLHIDEKMMDELKAIDEKINPRYKILVLDSMTGQESLKVAEAFDKSIGFSGALLTKMDSDTRGGAAFAFKYALKKPIYFVGSGEKVEDLDLFLPERMATRILGMGDVLSLIEKAEDSLDKKSQEDLAKKVMGGDFNLEDFSKQLDMMSKMGSIQKIAKYLPGMPNITPEAMQAGEHEAKIFKCIIFSMTPKERQIPKLLDSSRKQRIAKGSGTSVQEINKLLERLQQAKQFAKMFKKFGRGRGRF
ncbi:signal recognition particle protein [Candidatus Babeliales bacterium]|nr:signal recognition particle protein [Candidatus Babeliales bacterium]